MKNHHRESFERKWNGILSHIYLYEWVSEWQLKKSPAKRLDTPYCFLYCCCCFCCSLGCWCLLFSLLDCSSQATFFVLCCVCVRACARTVNKVYWGSLCICLRFSFRKVRTDAEYFADIRACYQPPRVYPLYLYRKVQHTSNLWKLD